MDTGNGNFVELIKKENSGSTAAEKAKEAVNYYDESGEIEYAGKDYIRLCRALVVAMEEIERDQLKSGNWDTQNGMLEALAILRKHLEADK